MSSFSNIRLVLLTGICFCCRLSVTAQVAFTLKGTVLDKTKSSRLSQVLINNLNTGLIVTTNELGTFAIKTVIGDTLRMRKVGYTTLKVGIKSKSDIFYYLQPVIQLAEVKITGETKRQELNTAINNYRSKGLYFDGRPPLIIFNPINGSPLTGFHELFGRDAANERRFIKFSNTEIETIEVSRRYSKQLVKQITALSDTNVTKFMNQYTPQYRDIKKWSDYEIITYIKEKLQLFKSK